MHRNNMANKYPDYTSVRLHRDTIERLSEWAEWGESRDSVINKVLDIASKKKNDT